VVLVTPSAEAVAAMGPNLLDSAQRGPAAQAGYAQAAATAAQVAAVWSGARATSASATVPPEGGQRAR
jgi:NTE family protein